VKPAASGSALPKPSEIVSVAPSGAASSGQLTKITICIPSRSTTTLPAYAAQQGGYLAQQHLDATFPYFAGATVDVALAANQCDMEIGSGGLGPLLQGVDIRMVAVTYDRTPFQIWARPSISSMADLKGGTLGNSGPGSLSSRMGQYFLKLNNLQPGKDVALVSTGADTVTLAALTGGRVDAAVLNFPGYLQAQEAGMKLLYKPPDTLHIVTQGIATTATYLNQHRDVMAGVVKAVLDSMTRLKSDPSFYASELKEYTGLNLDENAVQTYWKTDTADYNLSLRAAHQDAVTALSLYSEEAGSKNLDAIAAKWQDSSIVDEVLPASGSATAKPSST
jgi:ABC-type nitrate/sulfonate/bicarbonate transport system substrate-binding protein